MPFNRHLDPYPTQLKATILRLDSSILVHHKDDFHIYVEAVSHQNTDGTRVRTMTLPYDWLLLSPVAQVAMEVRFVLPPRRGSNYIALVPPQDPSHEMPELPADVVDNVFEHLLPRPSDDSPQHQDAKEDLRSCSLVCRTWHELARRHLFADFARTIGTVLRVQPRSYMSGMPDVYAVTHTLADLAAFLAANTAIAGAVRRMTLDFVDHADDGYGYADPGWFHSCGQRSRRVEKVEPALFTSLLQRLPSLEALLLYNLVLTGPPAPHMPRCRPLERLCIQHLGSAHAPEFSDRNVASIMACFSEAGELELVGQDDAGRLVPSEVESVFGDEVDDVSSTLKVRSLVLQRGHSGPLIREHVEPTLRRLVLRVLELRTAVEAAEFRWSLQDIGPRILELRIYLQHNKFHTDDPLVDVTCFPNIQELTIGFTLTPFVTMQCNRTLDVLSQLLLLSRLSQEHYPSLKEIVLEISFDPTKVINIYNPPESWVGHCKYLDVIEDALLLASERCGLRIVFECFDMGDVDGRECTTRMLPRLYSQGRMCFRERREHVWQSC